MLSYAERDMLEMALENRGILIDPGDHRPLEEIAQQFGVLASLGAEVTTPEEPEVV